MSDTFEFTPENQQKFEQILKHYPRRRAAMLPVIHLVQEQEGHVSAEAESYIARLLEVPVVDVHEVLSFYTLYFHKPMGRHHIRLCASISCWIRGCEEIEEHLKARIGVEEGEVSSDGEISWEVVPDCLGACELAPMMQLDGYFEGNLTREKVDQIFEQKIRLDSH